MELHIEYKTLRNRIIDIVKKAKKHILEITLKTKTQTTLETFGKALTK